MGCLGLVFGCLGDRKNSWLAGCTLKGTGMNSLRELNKTRGKHEFGVIAKGWEELNYPQLSSTFIKINCFQDRGG